MDGELVELVGRKLDADPDIDNAAGVLVLAALQGEEPLKEVLADGSSREVPDQEGGGGSPTTISAYLTSIAVQGFRGIGPRAELPIEPGPGLTLVVGPNGCGKSSFAEGLEILLTGNNRRWDDRARVWRDGWRNLHHEDLARVEAGLAIEGTAGETRVERSWDKGDQLSDSVATAQTIGHPRVDLSTLGWGAALENYRPFLPYNELGATLEGRPADLYDSVARVLGLDALVDARERLGQARRDREKAFSEMDSERRELVDALRSINDTRAESSAVALEQEDWGLDAVGDVLEGRPSDDADNDVALLRQLTATDGPDETAVMEACKHLRDAQAQVEELGGTDAQRALEVAGLLESALRFHEQFHDQSCPVCGVGALDGQWQERTEQQVASLRSDAAKARTARDALDGALKSARELLIPPPRVFDEAERVDVDVSNLREVWEEWLATPEGGDGGDLAEHIESVFPALRTAAAEVRERANAELQRREDVWRPVAHQLHT